VSGFVPDPGTDFTSGVEKEIAARLDKLGKLLGKTIHGISGARTPAHSVAVGGFANDPHTKGSAADIGVDGSLRASAGQLTDAQLASVGLYRPFSGAAEINHVQIKPGTESKSFLGKFADRVTSNPLGLLSPAIAAGADVGDLTGLDPIKAGQDAVGNVAGDVANKLTSMVTDAIGKDLLRWLLYAALVLGGVGLVVVGGGRVLGAGPGTS
jgi:hypothetical protein